MDLTPYLVGGAAARPDSLSGLDQGFTSALASMYAAAPEDIRGGLQITSGYRSPEVQQRLYAEALQKYGSEAAARKWVAPPGRSNHNHGHAIDMKYGSPAAQEWAHANAAQYGLAFPMKHEPWHVELAGRRGGGDASGGTGAVANTFMQQHGSAMPQGAVQAPLSFGPIGEGPAAPVLGQIAADWMNQQRDKQAARTAEDQSRRAALFGAPTGGLGSMYG